MDTIEALCKEEITAVDDVTMGAVLLGVEKTNKVLLGWNVVTVDEEKVLFCWGRAVAVPLCDGVTAGEGVVLFWSITVDDFVTPSVEDAVIEMAVERKDVVVYTPADVEEEIARMAAEDDDDSETIDKLEEKSAAVVES